MQQPSSREFECSVMLAYLGGVTISYIHESASFLHKQFPEQLVQLSSDPEEHCSGPTADPGPRIAPNSMPNILPTGRTIGRFFIRTTAQSYPSLGLDALTSLITRKGFWRRYLHPANLVLSNSLHSSNGPLAESSLSQCYTG